METMDATAAALCRSKKANGTQCDAPEAGGCRSCQQEVSNAYRFVDTTECFGCKRQALPGLQWFGRAICGVCAPDALSADMMKGDVDGDLGAIETAALEAGGSAGGEYLESIRQFSLERLTGEQWSTFLARVLTGYSASMRQAVKTTPPF